MPKEGLKVRLSEGSTLYLSAFIDELVRSGVRHIVVSPGSRSTPLAVLAAEHPELRVWLNIDERSASFFALGLAKTRREAVALLCTSGTAAANYLPAVAEAYLARVPLVVLTADRPHELREVGAPQTIRQIGLYGSHIKWFMEMPIPEAGAQMIRHARITAARAVAAAMSRPCGPVHLNFPLREPLLPDLEAKNLFGAGRENGQAYTRFAQGFSVPDEAKFRALARELSAADGIIVCGPLDIPGFAAAVTELAHQLRYPILADPLSQLRCGSHSREWVVDAYDAFLRDERVAGQLKPEVILRFGAMPVSAPLLQYIHRHAGCRYIIVDEGGWRDPTLLASEMIYADPVPFCRTLAAIVAETKADRGVSAWSGQWLELNRETRAVLQESGEDTGGEMFEGRIFLELNDLLPSDTVLFAGNSMPIRDLDTFFRGSDRNIRIMGNRGANGIDGLISTAMGASAAGERAVLVLGDLSFYHDMNGLLAAKLHGLSLTVIVVNNDGGGIFSFLPQAGLPRHFEELFGTPTGLDFAPAVAMYGGTFARAATWEEFRRAFRQAFAAGGLQVIEVRTGRERNVELHRGIWRKLSDRLASMF
jgi:2-succinyl-5-enolpyruvyl-6-hydroxy-3-cyclohexene-1-carboxylate synthase